MKLMKLAATLCALGLFAAGAIAQDKPGTIASLEFQTPKNGMVKQYEDGRKAKVEWHKQQKDKDALFVSEVLTGENTGSYIVGRFGMHWADMDTPSVTDAADLEQYRKVIEVVAFHIKYGRGDDFRSAVAKVVEANQKLKVPYHYSWYRLTNGGPGGTYVLTTDHANWASFEDDPAVTPLRDRLREAFGEQEAMSVIERLNSAVESTYSDLIQPRPDLSYLPAK